MTLSLSAVHICKCFAVFHEPLLVVFIIDRQGSIVRREESKAEGNGPRVRCQNHEEKRKFRRIALVSFNRRRLCMCVSSCARLQLDVVCVVRLTWLRSRCGCPREWRRLCPTISTFLEVISWPSFSVQKRNNSLLNLWVLEVNASVHRWSNKNLRKWPRATVLNHTGNIGGKSGKSNKNSLCHYSPSTTISRINFLAFRIFTVLQICKRRNWSSFRLALEWHASLH